jgi:hypothetical protein
MIPNASEYSPKLDQSPELDPGQAAYFDGLIGIVSWFIELGRIHNSLPALAKGIFSRCTTSLVTRRNNLYRE